MKNYLVSGLFEDYKVKINLFALSPNSAVRVFKQKYPEAKDIGLSGIPYWRNTGTGAILYVNEEGTAYAMCGPDFLCSEELNAKKSMHYLPIAGGAQRIKSNVIFALNSYWCDSYDINNSGKCSSGGWVNGSER